jgi:DNA-binding beta-propeller fold protein YncE
VYVADFNDDEIKKFDSNGNFITFWISKGTDYRQFVIHLTGISVDSNGNVYAINNGNHQI